MKEHPILFSTEMVKAILDGRKKQTRRIVRPNQVEQFKPDDYGDAIVERVSKVRAGDLLWVRETWKPHCPEQKTAFYKADGPEMNGGSGNWKPSIHMPRWACRLTMKVTKVRVERIQDISTDDVIAEGFPRDDGPMRDGTRLNAYGRKMCFAELWDSLNESRGYGWDPNPWVWVYDFERVEGLEGGAR